MDLILAGLEANRAIAGSLSFVITQAEFRSTAPKERASLAAIGKMGVGLSLSAATSLRLDYAEIEVTDPETYESYKARTPAVIAAHGGRFLVRGGEVEAKEGPPPAGRIVEKSILPTPPCCIVIAASRR